MSRILNTHVSLWDESGALITLHPGTELPDWAEGRVGEHCLKEDAPEEAAGEAKPASATPEKPSTTEAPDFTSAAPRRGRPRK